ncbi:hypothetical protein K443DRAFT_678821 [Laccaria amethystina LaAM-08-1]|uniref:Uncharacterized protein n=1 Tax=Laccaria amethystina LaAM-08-1 TaxID=1095629 RepID=A0A0C9XT20_9AGAR|nr:hypothetical protein K443DRAFT_678821 [Laccaria amethystina LaAM-08-1]
MAMHSILDSCNVSQVMPVEVDPPANIAWDSRDDWASVLAHIVESGRTDFKPISTTSRGSVLWMRGGAAPWTLEERPHP